jgi:hypothetical protein
LITKEGGGGGFVIFCKKIVSLQVGKLFAFGQGGFVIYLEGGGNVDFERGYNLGGYQKLPEY